ncbi:hypothetical protein VTI74DRAFT_8248 [Chaetomium olivicolor]
MPHLPYGGASSTTLSLQALLLGHDQRTKMVNGALRKEGAEEYRGRYAVQKDRPLGSVEGKDLSCVWASSMDGCVCPRRWLPTQRKSRRLLLQGLAARSPKSESAAVWTEKKVKPRASPGPDTKVGIKRQLIPPQSWLPHGSLKDRALSHQLRCRTSSLFAVPSRTVRLPPPSCPPFKTRVLSEIRP